MIDHDPNNYRGIALLSSLSKLFCNVLERRLQRCQQDLGHVCDEQFGFTQGRMALDASFALDTIIDSRLASGGQLYVAFVDFKKAYDFVPRGALFFKLLRTCGSGSFMRTLHSMYHAVESIVQYNFHFSEVIYQLVGLRQGCILSPCLFSLYIADFPTFLAERTGDRACNGVQLGSRVVRV